MELLRLILVDDEAILLQGLIETYDWNSMGFEVVGAAGSGEEALELIKEKKPHVVLTDIRMKQITGLMVMEETARAGIDCLFVVLSAYRDFKYAQQACELGAFAYLLKPIEDDKLQKTMTEAYESCMKKLEEEAKYDSWEKILKKDGDSFLQVLVQKYVQNAIPYEKIEEAFASIGGVVTREDRFITVCVDVDLAYKITNPLEYEMTRFTLLGQLEEHITRGFYTWKFEAREGNYVFIVRTEDNATVRLLKNIIEEIKKAGNTPLISAISKPYRGILGIKRSFEEAQKLFELSSASGSSTFDFKDKTGAQEEHKDQQDTELLIVNAVRKNNHKELKEAFVRFIYCLPREEEVQKQYIHKVMLKAEFMIKESYGMTESLKEQFQNYYSNIPNLNAMVAVDVCYKILEAAIDDRLKSLQSNEGCGTKDYMSDAVAYIEEHLHEEELSIVSVASYVYLNPVYFGRVFKNTFHMTFKQYLLKRRMERAKLLLEDGRISIGDICERVGISNSSYFAHLFKQYTGMLPSEYKKEYEG